VGCTDSKSSTHNASHEWSVVKYPTSRRIHRQGIDFVDSPSHGLKSCRVGLNFITFQNDPKRLFFILTDPRWMGESNFGGSPELKRHKIVSVISAGMFFVPRKEKPFPGVSNYH
jgi:deferrochelatase/peroxidase EfeB